MLEISQRARARKYPTRIKFIGIHGFRRRRKWGQPFTVLIYRRERMLGAWR
jgi:hypothetical protein